MKKLYTILAALMIGLISLAQQAPDFTLTDVKGNSYNLYQQLNQGKTVVLDFFGVQCGTCQTDLGYLENIWQNYGGLSGNVVIWGLESLGYSTSEVDAFVTGAGASFPRFGLAGNTELLTAYQVTATPTYIVICSNGLYKPVSVENIPNYLDACISLGASAIPVLSDKLTGLQFVQNQINITYESAQNGELTFELYDVLGNKLSSRKVIASNGYHSLSMGTSSLRPGFYIIRMMRGKELIMAKRMMKN